MYKITLNNLYIYYTLNSYIHIIYVRIIIVSLWLWNIAILSLSKKTEQASTWLSIHSLILSLNQLIFLCHVMNICTKLIIILFFSKITHYSHMMIKLKSWNNLELLSYSCFTFIYLFSSNSFWSSIYSFSLFSYMYLLYQFQVGSLSDQ